MSNNNAAREMIRPMVRRSDEEVALPNDDLQGVVRAIDRVQAMIEFNLDGTIVTANDNFLRALGYMLDEIQGRHHRMLCDPAYANSGEYQAFWEKLRHGEFVAGEFKRIGKGGKEVWIQASYNPITDSNGKVIKVVKFATDITEQKLRNADFEGQIAAIGKSQAVIEFSLDGTIVGANENFLKTLGYTLDEIKGRHHRMFCDPAYAASPEYQAFWEKLRRGEFDAGEYRRIGKGGKEVWISASYNPIRDLSGKPVKVMKYASDISKQKLKDAELEALSRTQAVIEFNLDGTIANANEIFMKTMGYRIEEIRGKHHSMFCDPDYVNSPKYREFWAKLNRGEFDAGQYKRFARGGREVWLQAAYNPVFDLSGKVFKVVKYASDITRQKNESIELIKALNETSSQLGAAAEELSATANEMAKNSQQTTAQSQSAAAAAEQVSKGVATMATNTEEMAASIKEIAKSSSEAADISRETLQRATDTNVMINQLGTSSREIGNVIKVISSIAQQTNLLALNATIEAARAGEAGKGFAVVANEVKELAKQTAKATEEITTKIGAIQGDSTRAVDSIGGIAKVIEKLNGISMSIAAAVEEQTTTTNEVSRVIQESSQGVGAIAETAKVVAGAAQQSSGGAAQTLAAARSLSDLAVKLKDLIKKIEL